MKVILTILILSFSTTFLIGQDSITLKNAKPILFYKIGTRGDTIDWSYGLVNNKDTFNIIKSNGEKSGFWIEYYFTKQIGNYKNGNKIGKWTETDKGWNETSFYDYGWLLTDTVYFNKRLYRHTNLTTARDTVIFVEYHATGKIALKRTIYLPDYCDKHRRFSGFGEHLLNISRTEYYDENGKLTRIQDPKK